MVKSINHRGWIDAPENTLSAVRMSKIMGYKYVEIDIVFTSDGIPVLSHDSTIDRCSNGTGKISEMTYEQLRQYDFGSWKSSKYTGEKIPNFKEFLRLCKSIDIHPYIELKSAESYTKKQIGLLVDTVREYGMLRDVTWISFNIDFLYWVASFDKKARIGYLQAPTTTNLQYVTDIKGGGADIFYDCSYEKVTDDVVEMLVENEIPLEVWTVNDESIAVNLNPYVSGITTDNLNWENILYNRFMQV